MLCQACFFVWMEVVYLLGCNLVKALFPLSTSNFQLFASFFAPSID